MYVSKVRAAGLTTALVDDTATYLRAHPNTVKPRRYDTNTPEGLRFQEKWKKLRNVPTTYRKKNTETSATTGESGTRRGATTTRSVSKAASTPESVQRNAGIQTATHHQTPAANTTNIASTSSGRPFGNASSTFPLSPFANSPSAPFGTSFGKNSSTLFGTSDANPPSRSLSSISDAYATKRVTFDTSTTSGTRCVRASANASPVHQPRWNEDSSGCKSTSDIDVSCRTAWHHQARR